MLANYSIGVQLFIRNVSFIQISGPYSTLISTVCDGGTNTGACTTAQAALATDVACTSAIATATDSSVICSGSCRSLINDIIDNCDASVSQYL